MKNILILNGPNLNLLGIRQIEIYGEHSLEEVIMQLREKFDGVKITHYQSNHEGDLIDQLHKYGFTYDGIVLNAGAYSHTSIAIADAVKSIETPVLELHISDILRREKFRNHSYLTEVCVHHIMGKGVDGYNLAVEYLLNISN